MPLQAKPIVLTKDSQLTDLGAQVVNALIDLVDQLNAQTQLYYTSTKAPPGLKEGDMLITRAGSRVSISIKSSSSKFDPVTLVDIDAINTAIAANTASISALTTSFNAFTGEFLTGTGTLDFPNTTANLSSDLTINVTGAATSDTVAIQVPAASVNANSCYTAWVSAANTVTVRFNNYSAGAINPASGVFKATVFKL